MKEFIENIAKELVDEPEKVEVLEIAGDKTCVFELKVAKTDVGKIIGKNGRSAKALRTILNATKTKKRMVLEILERLNDGKS